MTPIPEVHRYRLTAADGWLGLGDWLSANDELEALPAPLRPHPSVLALRARVFAVAGRWDVAEEIGRKVAETPAVNAELLLTLARCACALGKPVDARRWLACAFDPDDTAEFKLRALEDRVLGEAWTAEG